MLAHLKLSYVRDFTLQEKSVVTQWVNQMVAKASCTMMHPTSPSYSVQHHFIHQAKSAATQWFKHSRVNLEYTRWDHICALWPSVQPQTDWTYMPRNNIRTTPQNMFRCSPHKLSLILPTYIERRTKNFYITSSLPYYCLHKTRRSASK